MIPKRADIVEVRPCLDVSNCERMQAERQERASDSSIVLARASLLGVGVMVLARLASTQCSAMDMSIVNLRAGQGQPDNGQPGEPAPTMGRRMGEADRG